MLLSGRVGLPVGYCKWKCSCSLLRVVMKVSQKSDEQGMVEHTIPLCSFRG